jgi:hypothetical protein
MWQAAITNSQTPQQLCEMLGKDARDPALYEGARN